MKLMLTILLAAALLPAVGSAATSDKDYTEAMSREHTGDSPVAAAAGGAAARGISGERVEYDGFEGYLARPAGTPRAGLVVIHEWWGLNEHIREMANRLAAEGYLALAVDMYDGQVAEAPEQAREFMAATMDDSERVDAHLRAAFQHLAGPEGMVRIGSLGWCFGGALSLRTALLLPEQLDAAVIYYGRLVTDPAELAPLRMPILGIFGGQDRGIPVESVREFEMALEALGNTAEIVVYDEAGHAFANPSGTRYQPEAAADAWQRTKAFLAEHLAR